MQPLTRYINDTAIDRIHEFMTVSLPLCRLLVQYHQRGQVVKGLCPQRIGLDKGMQTAYLQPSTYPTERWPYMSPEETGRLNRPVDHRSNLYSLGVIFFELLVGSPPFQAGDPQEWIQAHLCQEPPFVCSLNPQVPITLGRIIAKLLAKAPEERYQSIKGLEADLVRCVRGWQTIGKISEFVLGQGDVPARLQMGHRLYGRKRERDLILEAFGRACRGERQWVMISGCAGVGKTALMDELRSVVQQEQGYFVTGRYEQYQGNVPYRGVVRVVTNLIRHILAGPAEGIATCRKRLQEGLGTYGGLMTEFIPLLKVLTGGFPPLRKMTPLEKANRFFHTFEILVQLLTQFLQPLVVFLDDLQWMDSASVPLIRSFKEARGRILFVGAYRSEEVDQDHPVHRLLHSLQDGGIPLKRLALESLDLDNTAALVEGILGQNNLEELVNSVYQQTAGNPLYVKQFLQDAYEAGELCFSPQELCWKYERKLVTPEVPETVTEVVINRLKRLPPKTVGALKRAASLGVQFSLSLLARCLGQSLSHTRSLLRPALTMGIILEDGETGGAEAEVYRFFHDRVREAVFSLFDPGERAQVAYEVGQVLLDDLSTGQDVFQGVDLLNLAEGLLQDEGQRLQVARLNLRAARQAKAAFALGAALQYLEAGIRLLPTHCWEQYYDLTAGLYLEYYWCKFLEEGFAAAEVVLDYLLARAKPPEQIEAYTRKTILCTACHTDAEAIEAGLNALRLLGLDIPSCPTEEDIQRELQRVRSLLTPDRLDAFREASQPADPRTRQILALVAHLIPPASLCNPALFRYLSVFMAGFSLEEGYTEYAPFAMACFGAFLSGDPMELPQLDRLQQLALELAQKVEAFVPQYRVYYTIGVYMNHWHRHVSSNLDFLQKCASEAQEYGDFLFVGAALTEMLQVQWFLGQSLAMVEKSNHEALAQLRRLRMQALVDLLQVVEQTIKNLRGETYGPFTLNDEKYDELFRTVGLLQSDSSMIVPFYYLLKIQTAYLHGGFQEAYGLARKLPGNLRAIAGKLLYAEYLYWSCLAAGQVAPLKEAQTALAQALDLFKIWSRSCPDNFLHKYYVLAAEEERLQGDVQRALRFYNLAIGLAGHQDFFLDGALACELAARLYMKLGMEDNARIYLFRAHQLYGGFGAIRKQRLLRAAYPRLLQEVYESSGILPEPAMDGAPSFVVQQEDFLYRVFQNLTVEPLDVVNTLLEVLSASTGASRVELLRVSEEELVSLGSRGEPPLGDHRLLPRSVLMYVVHTKALVILDDALVDPVFSQDPYIQEHRPGSLCCYPLTNDHLVYLENRTVKGVFASKQLELICKLCQALAAGFLTTNSSTTLQSTEELSLTSREAQILEAMGRGLSNREIGQLLYLSEGTVKWHTNRLFRKLGVSSRTQAVIKAKTLGLV